MTGQRHCIRPIADHDRAPESRAPDMAQDPASRAARGSAGLRGNSDAEFVVAAPTNAGRGASGSLDAGSAASPATASRSGVLEFGFVSSAGGPGRRNDSSAKRKRLLNVFGVFFLSLAVCRILTELFERTGWHHAADVATGLANLLVLLVAPPLGVYTVVKLVRGEIHW